MSNPKLSAWEEPLFELLRDVDIQLEDEFGDILPKHPSRPAHGTTANPNHDGLFRMTANFSMGYGSVHGKGYTLSLDFVTLAKVSDQIKKMVGKRALQLIKRELNARMPERNLEVKQDGNHWKIVGDLSLD